MAPDFFGPTGVLDSVRGQRIGYALALAAMHALKAQGYAYAIVGGVGPAAFYEKAFGAVAIPGSTPGIYAGMLRKAPG
jgi:predicted N-acetyltransferase YhbS